MGARVNPQLPPITVVTPCTLEGEAERVPEELGVVVRVRVDDTGRHHQAGGVELGGPGLVDLSHCGHAAVADPDVRPARRARRCRR